MRHCCLPGSGSWLARSLGMVLLLLMLLLLLHHLLLHLLLLGHVLGMCVLLMIGKLLL